MSESPEPDAVEIAALLRSGMELHGAGQLPRARQLYQKILALRPAHTDALNLVGVIALQEGKNAEAAALFERAIATAPDAMTMAPVYSNCAVALRALGRHDAALACYDRAVALTPGNADIWYNRANLLRLMGRRDKEALESYERVIALKPDSAEAYVGHGLAARGLKRYGAAVESFAKAMARDAHQPFLEGLLLHTKMQVCDWSDFDAHCASLAARIAGGAQASPPFPLLSTLDSIPLQRKAAETWVQANHPPNGALGPLPRRARAEKIRVGYFSMDFRNHPVAYLTAELFERHDRDRFEVYAFSYGGPARDDMRARLERAFDHFVDISDKSDTEAAALARSLDIDIAVDLAGHTTDARTGIFACRAAPVQVSYIGYPGTMGATYIHYVLADDVVVPPAARALYSEKIVALPWFQVNSARPAVERARTRQDDGLPETGFVFASFNNAYKITPHVFDSWVRILNAVPGSTLLLYAQNDFAAANLRKEAGARGLAPQRLVLCGKLPLADYLARCRSADLFLDTFPYNAGTTASDALSQGLPVLTRAAQSFASRMGASLLQAVGLPELITTSPQDYEAAAIALANQPERLRAMREKLLREHDVLPLFDIKAFTLNLEHAYGVMVDRYYAAQAPQ